MFIFYRHDAIDVHLQALAALANLARNSVGRQTIVDAGALPEFIRLLSSSDPRVLEYSSTALRNIAMQDSLATSIIDAVSARPCPTLTVRICFDVQFWMFTFYRHDVIDVHRPTLAALAKLSRNTKVARQAIVDTGAFSEVLCLLEPSGYQFREYIDCDS